MRLRSPLRGGTAGRLAAALLALLASAIPAAATVRTYASSPAAVIPDALPPGPGTPRSVSATLTVPDRGQIRDVDVTVTLRHPGHGDLSLALTDPSGAVTVRLIHTEGGPGDGLSNVTFDDEAADLPPGFVVNGTCLVDQTYRPAPDVLSALDGLEVGGTWTLTVTDLFAGDAADCDCDGAVIGPACPRTLDRWALTIDFDGDGGEAPAETVFGCREVAVLIGIILLMLAILWLLVTKTRP